MSTRALRVQGLSQFRACHNTRAETIIHTSRLLGYESTTRRQYGEIGSLFSYIYHHIADFTRSLKLRVFQVKTLKAITVKHFRCILFLKYPNITLLANLPNNLVNFFAFQHLVIRHFLCLHPEHIYM